MTYSCKRCGYETDRKSNIIHHLEKQKVCSPSLNDLSRDVLIAELNQPKDYKCDVCQKTFSHRQTLHTHKKTHINRNNQLCDRINQLSYELELAHQKIREMSKPCLQSTGDVATGLFTESDYNTVSHNHSPVTTTNSHNTNTTIIINNFGHENLSYIPPDLWKKSASYEGFGVSRCISQKHFHPDHPENHNIKYRRGPNAKIYKDDMWKKIPLKEAASELIVNSLRTLRAKFHEHNICHTYPPNLEDVIMGKMDKPPELEPLINNLYDYAYDCLRGFPPYLEI